MGSRGRSGGGLLTGGDGGPLGVLIAPANNHESTLIGGDYRARGQVRVYAEFFDGRRVFGQLFNARERYAGLGVALDY